MGDSICKVPDCAGVVGRSCGYGYCRPHYRAYAKHGDPLLKFGRRQCAECGITFEPTHGSHKSCVDCRGSRERRMQAEYRASHKEQIKRANAAWVAAHPDYHSAWNKRWRAENPEAYKAYYTQYRIDNLELVRERFAKWEAANPKHSTEWSRANPERARETVRRRRARLKSVETFPVTERDLRRMLTRHRNCCVYCDAPLTTGYHVDHVMPVSLGGRNSVGNIAPACADCNISKSNWMLSEWRYRSKLSHPLKRRRSTHVRASSPE